MCSDTPGFVQSDSIHMHAPSGAWVRVVGARYRLGRFTLSVQFPSGRIRTWDAAHIRTYVGPDKRLPYMEGPETA